MKSGDRLTVDQECIDQGDRQNICACPISLAFLKAGYVRAYVSSHDAALEDPGGNYYLVSLCFEAGAFIHIYDSEGAYGVEPFTFPVNLVKIDYCPFSETEGGKPAIRIISEGDIRSKAAG